jgi:hypothetical protein
VDTLATGEYVLVCAILTLAVLVLSNRVEVRQALALRLQHSGIAVFVAALPGRTAVLVLGALVGLVVGRFLPHQGSTVALSSAGAALGYLLNVPFLIYTVQQAWLAGLHFKTEVRSALDAGMEQACQELERGELDHRVWRPCLREAEDDTEIAGSFYMRRRAKALAKEAILCQTRWDRWLPREALAMSLKGLVYAWEADHGHSADNHSRSVR